ncbi:MULTISPECIES: hypothetical protein [Methylosinus]|uniref:Uncharacterized protein n=1 Tax=Methylosinus trichosporium (strain ATCC 35070 / NCIMB 11131 / UNIQEM 75 / OB3b) TaxID=595536 RepID=A0A2D2CYG7_METT3|nr:MULTISPECIES: hypothetical protein [Methylosinus]ATQ67765.1 hypothetical protein CQW49_07560 [Methylosinus trichosporium OB3b]OBS51784.1 hypothetical protein A8B73_14065 [Methylosinus sp. 3S-1]
MTETSALQFLGYVKAGDVDMPTNDIDALCEGDDDVVELVPIFREASKFAAVHFAPDDIDHAIERRKLFETRAEADAFVAESLQPGCAEEGRPDD